VHVAAEGPAGLELLQQPSCGWIADALSGSTVNRDGSVSVALADGSAKTIQPPAEATL